MGSKKTLVAITSKKLLSPFDNCNCLLTKLFIYRNKTATRTHALNEQSFLGIFQGLHYVSDEVKKQRTLRSLLSPLLWHVSQFSLKQQLSLLWEVTTQEGRAKRFILEANSSTQLFINLNIIIINMKLKSNMNWFT